MKTLLKNAYLVDYGWEAFKDLVIEDEIIVSIEDSIDEESEKFDQIYDLKGKIIVPGGVDPHTHMELQQSEKYRSVDDFYYGSLAAAAGGTTTIIDHIAFGPKGANLHYSLDIYHELAKKSVIDYSFHGVIQEVNDSILKEMDEIIRNEGITSFKAYSTYAYAMSDLDFYKLFKQMKESGGLLTIHCENDAITSYLTEDLRKQGKAQIKNYPDARPVEAESETVDRVIELAKVAGDAPLYIVHISAGKSAEKLREAKKAGQENLYGESCPQYLILDDSKYRQEDPLEGLKYLMAPPLRKKEDQEILWKALADGTIDTIGTDHCPFNFQTDKLNGKDDFSQAPGGISGVEDRMMILFSEGVLKHKISLQDYVALTSSRPAKIFGLYPKKGSLELNTDADLLVIDPSKKHVISKENQYTTCDYNPYEGLEIQGSVDLVFSRGDLIFKAGEFLGDKGHGQFIKRKPY